MKNTMKVVKVLIFVLMIAYIVSPMDLCPGPMDDIIVLLIGLAATKGTTMLKNHERRE